MEFIPGICQGIVRTLISFPFDVVKINIQKRDGTIVDTFKNIVKKFGDKLVLNDVSHKMETGKTNLIIGTSGSGKTVLQKCLVGLIEPDEGEGRG